MAWLSDTPDCLPLRPSTTVLAFISSSLFPAEIRTHRRSLTSPIRQRLASLSVSLSPSVCSLPLLSALSHTSYEMLSVMKASETDSHLTMLMHPLCSMVCSGQQLVSRMKILKFQVTLLALYDCRWCVSYQRLKESSTTNKLLDVADGAGGLEDKLLDVADGAGGLEDKLLDVADGAGGLEDENAQGMKV
ncbi:hypothetical protein ACLOJK_017530 [Asimina triloba]